jgi:hypothetical protein
MVCPQIPRGSGRGREIHQGMTFKIEYHGNSRPHWKYLQEMIRGLADYFS